tara:strand:- start:45 stop:452 length:408 start_codon:yes stop_codon:yes gene_type:complete
MSKPGKVLKGLCKRLGVRLTVKRGKKRVYKSVTVLKAQCKRKAGKKKKKKKKKKVKRKRKFGAHRVSERYNLPDRVENRIASFLGPNPRKIAQLRREAIEELELRAKPLPILQRQVAQQDLGDFGEYDPGFGNEF